MCSKDCFCTQKRGILQLCQVNNAVGLSADFFFQCEQVQRYFIQAYSYSDKIYKRTNGSIFSTKYSLRHIISNLERMIASELA